MTAPVACVLGAGVSGLTTALRLYEVGWDVHIISEEIGGYEGVVSLASSLASGGIVSAGAGAIWEYPPFSIEPQKEAKQWVLSSRPIFESLSASSELTGVRLRRNYYLYRKTFERMKAETRFEVPAAGTDPSSLLFSSLTQP